MKIGVLTFWKTSDNYGQVLQCFALQTYLRSLGHETFLVRTTSGNDQKPSFKMQFMDRLRTAYRLLPFPVYLFKNAVRSGFYFLAHGKFKEHQIERGFDSFRRDYLNCTKVYTLQMLQDNPPEADMFIVGSDQIWNTTDGIYFLSWVKDHIGKVAYAASFGARLSSPEFCKLISPWLKRFDHVSVREQSGLAICDDAGCEHAVCLPDPTLLLHAKDYLAIASEYPQKNKYLLTYFLGTRTSIDWKEIHRFAKKNHLEIVYVASQGQVDKFRHTNASVGEWLSLVANAEYVITNSFHGTVFSLLFGKKFMTYPVSGPLASMNDRIFTLLTPLGLRGRIYANNLESIRMEIDYVRVHSEMDSAAWHARTLLKEWTE